MEWVEITDKTVEAAREAALDELGVGADEAEFDIVEEPRPGLFGRMRGEARLRARVKPTPVRPKQERRRRGRSEKPASSSTAKRGRSTREPASADTAIDTADDVVDDGDVVTDDEKQPTAKKTSRDRSRRDSRDNNQEKQMHSDDRPESQVTPQEVGDAAIAFMNGLTEAFGADGEAALTVDDLALDVQVTGSELGLLVGPGGRTLNAIQDLARVAAQRRLGDHDTRLRIDVAGYRSRREAALGQFARDVAEQVRSSGAPRSLEPMASADRKVVHDVLNELDGVTSRSEGEDPNRRIIVDPV